MSELKRFWHYCFWLKIRIFTFLNFLKHSCAPQQFTAASLKNFQGCIVVYLSRFICDLCRLKYASHISLLLFISATAYLEYHKHFALSTGFFDFFILFFRLSKTLFRGEKKEISIPQDSFLVLVKSGERGI